jgi:cation:H+ antiporter
MYFWLILGLVTLIVGGEVLVRGAVGIAKKANISTLVIGMTVISFGTSAPELFVSIDSAMEGNPEIAIGNVVGSNIANIALVLGITVLIFPIAAGRNSKLIDWPMMMLATILFFVFSLDLVIEVWEGAILFGILLVFTFLLIRNSRRTMKKDKQQDTGDDEVASIKDKIWVSILLLLCGFVGLYFGAEWLVNGAVDIASSFGMEKRIIAVTVVAFGTSVPELVTSAVAAFKKETDISVGNLIGSNIFNIMAVIGITSLIKPIPVQEAVINFDMWWVLAIAAVVLPMMLIGKKIGRIHGALLFSTYVIYISVLVASI